MTTRTLRRLERLEREQQTYHRKKTSPGTRDLCLAQAPRDPYIWVTQHTRTINEHWREEGRPSPHEPFPKAAYFAALFEAFDQERIVWIEKSRDLMVTWACVAYMSFHAMTVPARGVLFQTQKEDKVIQMVDAGNSRTSSPSVRIGRYTPRWRRRC